MRKTSNLAKVDIVFLPDAAATEGGPPPAIEAKVKEREAEIADTAQGNRGQRACCSTPINSRQILMRDVLARRVRRRERRRHLRGGQARKLNVPGVSLSRHRLTASP